MDSFRIAHSPRRKLQRRSDGQGLESRLHVELWGFALADIYSPGGGGGAAILVSTVGSRRACYDMHVLPEREGEVVHAGRLTAVISL